MPVQKKTGGGLLVVSVYKFWSCEPEPDVKKAGADLWHEFCFATASSFQPLLRAMLGWLTRSAWIGSAGQSARSASAERFECGRPGAAGHGGVNGAESLLLRPAWEAQGVLERRPPATRMWCVDRADHHRASAAEGLRDVTAPT